MAYQFKKHYTLAEAQALLPQVRQWLEQLLKSRDQLQKSGQAVSSLMQPGVDVGGEVINGWIRDMLQLRAVAMEFERRQVLIKDLERGLVDFPAIVDGREIFLCWEKGEPDIEFWHDLDTGYAGRERL